MEQNVSIEDFLAYETEKYEVFCENVKKWVDWNKSCYVGSDKFPDIQSANFPIVLISMYNSVDEVTTVYGMKDYAANSEDDFTYVQFRNEKDLLKAFIE